MTGSHPSKANSAAFTIMELLVAMVVLAMILALFLQISRNVADAYVRGRSNIDNYATGRALMDAMARDLHGAILRADLPCFPASGARRLLAFYTTQPGIESGVTAERLRNLSFVEYSMETNSDASNLQRSDAAIFWDDNSKVSFGSTAPPSTTPRTLAAGVLSFDYRFIRKDATMAADPSDLKDVAGVRFSIAVADKNSFRTLRDLGSLDQIRQALNQAVSSDANVSARAAWEELMRNPGFTAQYPSKVLSGIRFFERAVPLTVESDGS